MDSELGIKAGVWLGERLGQMASTDDQQIGQH